MRLQRLDEFHPTIAYGDATSNDCFEIQRELWAREVPSDLFAGRALPEVRAFVRDFHGLVDRPRAADEALLFHHSMGNEAVDRVAAWPGRKILRYHNITPARYFAGLDDEVAKWATVGREQLARLAGVCELGIGVSEYNRRELEAAGFLRTTVVPVFVDWSAFDLEPDARVAAELARVPTPIVYVGQVLPHKGVRELLDGFARYAESDPGASLYVVGSSALSGAHRLTLDDRVAALGLGDRVRFTGGVALEELVAYFRGARVFVTLSEHEGFGVTVLEAMRAGTPVVAYAAAALPDTVGDAGLLLPDRTPETVADALARAAGDERLRADLAAKGRRRLDEFSRERVWSRLVDALASLGLELPAPPRRRVLILTSAQKDDAHEAGRALAEGLIAHGHAAEIAGVRRADNADLAAKIAALGRPDAVVIEHEFGIFRELRFVQALLRLRLRALRVVLSLRELEPETFHSYRAFVAAARVPRRFATALEIPRLALLAARVAWRFLHFRLVALAMGSLPSRIVVHSPRAREWTRVLTDDWRKVDEIPSLVPPPSVAPPRTRAERNALRATLGLPPDAFVFLSPGFFYGGRRFLEVIAATPRDAMLVLCGDAAESDPAYREAIVRHIETHRVANARVLEGARIGEAVAASDCMVLFDEDVFQSDNASRAIAGELPCVFSDIPSYRLYDGAGLFARDVEELREAMLRVREPETQARLRRRTRVLRRMLAPERLAMRYLAGLFEP